MVLSNKKLKQKLRDAKADLIVESEVHGKLTGKVTKKSGVLESKTPDSLKSLLIPKRLLSKREKRRQKMPTFPSGESDVLKNRENGTDTGANKEVELKSDTDIKKTKKRKKANGDMLEDAKQAKRLNKNKKRKNNNKLKKVENEPSKMDGIEQDSSKASQEQLMPKADEGIDRENGSISSKVYVGGIPYYSSEDDIRSYFEGCGTITNVDCMEFPDTGKFRGIAIITFKTEAAAKRALAFDGSDMGGLFLKIQPFKTARMNKTSNFSPSFMEGYNRIYVGNLSWNITENDLRQLFSDCSVTTIRFGEDKETKEFKGYAHVDFADSLSLSIALKLDQETVCGRPVRISCAVPRKGSTSISSTSNEITVDRSKVNVSETNPSTDETEINEVTVVSSKIKGRTCYECGEKGHLSSSCPNKTTNDSKMSDEIEVNVVGETNPCTDKTEISEVTVVSSKIKGRTCYECGEKGHLSSSCPNKPTNDSKMSNEITVDWSKVNVVGENTTTPYTDKTEINEVTVVSSKIRGRTCYECGEKGHLSSSCPNKTTNDSKTSNETTVDMKPNTDKTETSEATPVSSKIKRRTCYECGGKGHLSSSCPNKSTNDSNTLKEITVDGSKVNVVDETNLWTDKSEINEVVSSKIRRRTCYECGEKGHLSSSCPNKTTNDSKISETV